MKLDFNILKAQSFNLKYFIFLFQFIYNDKIMIHRTTDKQQLYTFYLLPNIPGKLYSKQFRR